MGTARSRAYRVRRAERIFWTGSRAAPVARRLSGAQMLSDQLKDKFEKFEELLVTLKTSQRKSCATKVTRTSTRRFAHRRTLEYLSFRVRGTRTGRWSTRRTRHGRGRGLTRAGRACSRGVGHANEIGRLPVEANSLTRGAVSVYEFQHPSATPDDEKGRDAQHWKAGRLNRTKSFLPGQKKGAVVKQFPAPSGARK